MTRARPRGSESALGLVGWGTLLLLALRAAPIEAGTVLTLQQLATGLDRPVAITHAGDGSGWLFITLLAGKIVIYDGTQVLAAPFLDISGLVSTGGERGLFSVAFHPNYASNGFLYVFYTDLGGDLVIARYSVSGDPNLGNPASAMVLLVIEHSAFSNHNGGQLQFGPDGYLYAGIGDASTAPSGWGSRCWAAPRPARRL